MLDQLPPVRLHHDRRRRRGGEYDELRALDRHTVRRLVGARFISPAGSPPDELVECWNDLFGTDLQTCDVIRRWSRDCLEHIEERQRAARARREANLVRRSAVVLGVACASGSGDGLPVVSGDAQSEGVAGMNDSFFEVAACKGMDPDIFHPEKGDVRTELKARQVCRGCTVKADCLEWALVTNQTHGIWGDTSERQRRKLRRDRRTAAGLGGRGPVPSPVVHGDHRSYRKCCALNGGRACVACREAMVRYRGGKRDRATERAGGSAVQCSTCGRLCASAHGLLVHSRGAHRTEAA